MEVLGWSKELLDAKVSWNCVCELPAMKVINHTGYIRSVQKSIVRGLCCLVECEDGYIHEVKVEDLRFERGEKI